MLLGHVEGMVSLFAVTEEAQLPVPFNDCVEA